MTESPGKTSPVSDQVVSSSKPGVQTGIQAGIGTDLSGEGHDVSSGDDAGGDVVTLYDVVDKRIPQENGMTPDPVTSSPDDGREHDGVADEQGAFSWWPPASPIVARTEDEQGKSLSEAGAVGSPPSRGEPPDSVSPPLPAEGEGTPPPAIPPNARAKEDDADRPMSLLEHLGELRSRLVRAFLGILVAFFVCYGFAKELYHYLSLPLLEVMPADAKFIYTGVAEGFFVDLKVALVAAVFMASPYLFYQIWAFIAPGLYEEEKRYVLPLSFFSAIFFLGGAAFCYFVVFPFAFVFFLSYSTDNIVAMLSISEYLSFSLKMLIAFGLIFEMPLFAFFLARMGLVTSGKMREMRKYAVLGVFVVAAVLTPPDVFSQLLMAVPMLLLYEASIGVAAVFGRRKTADREKTVAPGEPAGNAAPHREGGEA